MNQYWKRNFCKLLIYSYNKDQSVWIGDGKEVSRNAFEPETAQDLRIIYTEFQFNQAHHDDPYHQSAKVTASTGSDQFVRNVDLDVVLTTDFLDQLEDIGDGDDDKKRQMLEDHGDRANKRQMVDVAVGTSDFWKETKWQDWHSFIARPHMHYDEDFGEVTYLQREILKMDGYRDLVSNKHKQRYPDDTEAHLESDFFTRHEDRLTWLVISVWIYKHQMLTPEDYTEMTPFLDIAKKHLDQKEWKINMFYD